MELSETGGILYVIGMGCGSREGMTLEAVHAVEASDLIIGYTVYTDLMRELFPEKEMRSTGMRKETQRVNLALDEAGHGKNVSLICSGDAAVYGMAALSLELCEKRRAAGEMVPEIRIVAGVTAALSGGALLGAPLTNDFALISLSDLLTAPEVIEKRLRCAAEGDFVIVLYNPSSKGRPHHLKKACEILLQIRPADTCCGYVRQIGRKGQESGILSLRELADFPADMFTTVFIGNSATVFLDGRLVTPRGYRDV